MGKTDNNEYWSVLSALEKKERRKKKLHVKRTRMGREIRRLRLRPIFSLYLLLISYALSTTGAINNSIITRSINRPRGPAWHWPFHCIGESDIALCARVALARFGKTRRSLAHTSPWSAGGGREAGLLLQIISTFLFIRDVSD